jgi:hypothetical protein
MDLVVADCRAHISTHDIWYEGLYWEVSIKLDREEFGYESVNNSFGSL